MRFNCPQVANFLEKYGRVYTVRRHRYRVGGDVAKTEKGTFPIMVSEVGPLQTVDDLKPFLEFSGFKTLKEWVEEIYKLHRSDYFRNFYLYSVLRK